MKELNSRGFSAIEGLLILIVVTIIGGTGYYVYSVQKKTTESQKDTAATSQTELNKTDKKVETDKPDPYKGWKEYSDATLGFSFKYPPTWTTSTQTFNNNQKQVILKTADYESEIAPIGATVTTKGAAISVDQAVEKDINALSDFEKSIKVELKELAIGTKKGVEYRFGYEGPVTYYARVPLTTQKYVQTGFGGNESEGTNFSNYKLLLASIKAL